MLKEKNPWGKKDGYIWTRSGKWYLINGFDNKVMVGAWPPGQSENILRVTNLAKRLNIPTACPFCLVNMEDAIKVAGLEGQMEAVDLAELAARQLA
jgi:hypothetical protein